VLQVDPSIVVTALLGTSVVFISFSVCALMSERGKWLFLGGPLLALMNVMVMMMVVSLFTGSSSLIYNANVYLGLLAMCGFVLFDTQLIVEKRLMGDDDFIAHSVDLFIDLVGIFRRLLVILTRKEQDSRNKKRDD
jgi:Bax inhibitor 1